jgi:hypothetical protein
MYKICYIYRCLYITFFYIDIPVAKIQAIHAGGIEAKKADLNTVYSFEVYILLVKRQTYRQKLDY